jgi:hypothetical protein
MNSNGLARHYDCLSPWERLPLLVSAAARGDELERDRLSRSAPELCFCVPHFWGLVEGFNSLAMHYMLRQLDLAAIYERVERFLEQEAMLGNKEAPPLEGPPSKTLQTLAHRFVVRADAWTLLCAELHIAPNVLLRELPGYDTVQAMEKIAREVACTAEQAIAYLRQGREAKEPATGAGPSEGGEFRIATAEDEARCMREFLEERLEAWS